MALFCHPDRPDNTDKELFTRIFQKITAANEGFTGYRPRYNEQHRSTDVSKANESRRYFGPIAPEIDEYIKKLKSWLEEYVLFFFDTPNMPFRDIKIMLFDVESLCDLYKKNDNIGPLYYKIYAKAILNVLSNSNSLSKEQQIWVVSKLLWYYTNYISDEYKQIMTSGILFEKIEYRIITQIPKAEKIPRLIELLKLADSEGESRIETLKTMVNTVKENKNHNTVKSLNQFIRENIEGIFDFLPK